jgi:hypothetical protein
LVATSLPSTIDEVYTAFQNAVGVPIPEGYLTITRMPEDERLRARTHGYDVDEHTYLVKMDGLSPLGVYHNRDFGSAVGLIESRLRLRAATEDEHKKADGLRSHND